MRNDDDGKNVNNEHVHVIITSTRYQAGGYLDEQEQADKSA